MGGWVEEASYSEVLEEITEPPPDHLPQGVHHPAGLVLPGRAPRAAQFVHRRVRHLLHQHAGGASGVDWLSVWWVLGWGGEWNDGVCVSEW